MYEVTLESKAEKQLLALEDQMLRKAYMILEKLAENPRPSGCLKLKGKTTDGWRMRAGSIRILYRIDDALKQISVYAVLPRDKAYK